MAYHRLRPLTSWPLVPLVDPGHSINDSLFGFWPLSEHAGLLAGDASTWRQQAALVNYTSRTMRPGPAGLGNALSFNGTNQYVNGPTNVPLGTNTVSISLWIYFVSTAGYGSIISKNAGDNNSGNWDWGLLFSNPGPQFYLIRNGANVSAISYSLTANVWTHVGVVISDTQSLTYANGVLVDSQGGVGSGATSNTAGRAVTFMGAAAAGSFGSSYVTGSMQNARVWNRGLLASEFMALYRSPLIGIRSPRLGLPHAPRSSAWLPRLVRRGG